VGDFEKPELIRLSLGSKQNKNLYKGLYSQKFPGFMETIIKTKSCLLTSWATFYKDMKFDGCK
jgi:hypothetical protein